MQAYIRNILGVWVGPQEHRLLGEHTVLLVVAGLDSSACAGRQISMLDYSRSQIQMANFTFEHQKEKDKAPTRTW
jgi:hypothetical protein